MKIHALIASIIIALAGTAAITVQALYAQPQAPESKEKTASAGERWSDIPIGFDGYPKRNYSLLFNNVLYNVLYRPSPFTGYVPIPAGTVPAAKTFESGYSTLERLSNYPINLLYDKIGVGWTSLIMLVKAALLDFPFAYTIKVFNHEFSGHVARIYESGGLIDKIEVGVPLPWGKGGGSTSFYMTRSIDKIIFTSTAGSEANTVLAHEMALGFVSNRVIYSFDILLYLNARFDQLLYVNNASKNPNGLRLLVSGDYEEYLVLVNNKYGRVFPHTYRLKLDELKRWSYAALADPFLYLSTMAFFYNLATGKRYMRTWMIPLGKTAMIMPSSRVAYTPNGPECYGDLFFNLPRHTVLLMYGRGGSRTLRQTWGAGIRLYSVDLGRYAEIGGGFDLFSQPRVMNYISTLFLENYLWNSYLSVTSFIKINPLEQYGALTFIDAMYGYKARAMKRIFGGAGYVDLTIKGGERFRAYIRMGYKSRGYVFGLKLQQGFFWHTGVGYNF
jgi:hypothetical protein